MFDGQETLSGQRMSREDAAIGIQAAQLNEGQYKRVEDMLRALGIPVRRDG